jgi:hypothetical protein
MLYVVEIRDKQGNTTCKEYVALSIRDAFSMAHSELAQYPNLTINDVWQKDSPMPGLFGSRAIGAGDDLRNRD